MRSAFAIVAGVVLVLVGLIWILQGVGILPGSFMSRQLGWAVAGALLLAVGLGLLAARLRPRARP